MNVSLNPYLSFMPRYSIDQSTDQEQIFNIDPVTGDITLGKILDRETAGWHNITVTAVQAGTLHFINRKLLSVVYEVASILCI